MMITFSPVIKPCASVAVKTPVLPLTVDILIDLLALDVEALSIKMSAL